VIHILSTLEEVCLNRISMPKQMDSLKSMYKCQDICEVSDNNSFLAHTLYLPYIRHNYSLSNMGLEHYIYRLSIHICISFSSYRIDYFTFYQCITNHLSTQQFCIHPKHTFIRLNTHFCLHTNIHFLCNCHS
jgi:hypothetical protein